MGQADLVHNPAGLGASTVAAHPELTGYLALELDKRAARQVPDILTGQVAVALYDLGGLLDAAGVQRALVLDSIYAKAAAGKKLGASFDASGVTFRVWAPTAQQVTLLTWPASSPADAPVSAAKRLRLARDVSGTWAGTENSRAENARYLYEVTVFAPATGKVETNGVTEPYSAALTLNSTRSVAVDLADPAWAPRQWARPAALSRCRQSRRGARTPS